MQNDRQKSYEELRNRYPGFIFSGYSISESAGSLDLDFTFEIPGLAEFKPRWTITKPSEDHVNLCSKRLGTLVFSLGMVELISYWKIACPPHVYINCGSLSDGQIAWWKNLYRKGLGEFFYTNGICADDDVIEVTAADTGVYPAHEEQSVNDGTKVLIPIGGGKDSAVTLELLGGYAGRYCYVINPGRAALDTVSAGGIDKGHLIIANRTLDANMLALNKQGYLNGHTPFSALVAFSSATAAYMHGIGYIALSNESSANEPTVMGCDVNHQYSKSIEFESGFIDYEARYISSGIKYFSLLRPLTELGIAKIFSRFEKYHPVFRSCNAGSRENIWCAKCPKCLFVYIILSPFLPAGAAAGLFGEDMLDNRELIPVLDKLIGLKPEKPFECVGSRDEVNAALQQLIYQYESKGAALPELAGYYKGLGIDRKYDFHGICSSYDENNHIPGKFVQAVKNALKEQDND